MHLCGCVGLCNANVLICSCPQRSVRTSTRQPKRCDCAHRKILCTFTCWCSLSLAPLYCIPCPRSYSHQEVARTIFRFYAPVTTAAGSIIFSSCPPVHLSRFCERDTSEMPWWKFFKSGTSVHLDSRVNRLDLDCQRSRPVNSRLSHFSDTEWLAVKQ